MLRLKNELFLYNFLKNIFKVLLDLSIMNQFTSENLLYHTQGKFCQVSALGELERTLDSIHEVYEPEEIVIGYTDWDHTADVAYRRGLFLSPPVRFVFGQLDQSMGCSFASLSRKRAETFLADFCERTGMVVTPPSDQFAEFASRYAANVAKHWKGMLRIGKGLGLSPEQTFGHALYFVHLTAYEGDSDIEAFRKSFEKYGSHRANSDWRKVEPFVVEALKKMG